MREQAEAEENAAHAEAAAATCKERTAKASLAAAGSDVQNAKEGLSDAKAAVFEAERALEVAKECRQEALDRMLRASSAESDADIAVRDAVAHRIVAEGDKERARLAKEKAQSEEKKLRDAMPGLDSEAQRQAELAEMIRRMRELNKVEESGRRERQVKEQREREETERRRREAELAERAAREERERKAREEEARKAREEQEQRQAEAQRLQEYRDAAAKECDRCTRRDARWTPWITSWTNARHVSWFSAVGTEFDEIKFCASQPLTFESVPWPLLLPPQKQTLDSVEWAAVEAFFAATKVALGEEQHKATLEKAHRRFHPDRWRSRGLLNTVLDEALRKRLEEAGNTVAQAITPLWLASKSAR
ncbi:uncharacterized protein PHACADRAFT_131666 [Phanerochaete carnosa HHB-10118-sp]|uniref:J domain-containing protein n=1 Tax=Phanerochaete carnosa (strain HHB-10118-sp) TaxID=650164 RepID=K5VTF1_PHACS|nr:uncharacterized protein PHACADRAFT_131666 [Phanerochaete carnosa HHB-10118-sp]EKM49819.1 hypothetical protein PHACADRAFT_131666 [Phanerochaete carnosa HHB-10118-sp]